MEQGNNLARWRVGDVYSSGGQEYTLTAIESVKRRRGSGETLVLHWRSRCAVCGAEYATRSGPTARGASVHCPAHKLNDGDRIKRWLASMHTPAAKRKSAETRRRKAEDRKRLESLF